MKKKVMLTMMLAASAVLFGGCNGSFNSFGLSSFLYDDADKYTMGNATFENDKIESVDISWVTGEVTVHYHDEDTIVISETANKDLDEENTMYHWVDGDTLRVKFVKSGKWDFTGLSKELTVWLPQDMVLEEMIVDSVSADVSADGIAAEKAILNTVSGSIELMEASISQSVELDTTSGDVTATLLGKLEDMSADSVSGRIDVTMEDVQEVEADSTSGEIRLAMKAAPDSLSADTISGDVVLCLPKDADFTIRMDSVSGSVKSKRAMKEDGDDYIFGAGTKKYDVDTTSGSLRVEEME